jgi:BirA family biotin operon repressor/biotin-[acetyl-CoA-carboxylase] ligase
MADPIVGAYMIDPAHFEHVARIDSTSSELMRRPFGATPAAPRALLADLQHGGRGRNGRGWIADPAGSLALSVAIERPADGAALLGLPLAVGVAIAGVLAAHGARPRLKWPNDLLVDGADGLPAKAGGILVELRQPGTVQRIVVGCGLNLEPSAAPAAAAIGQRAGGLFACGAAPPRLPLARALADAIAGAVEAFARDGLAPWRARWAALDALEGSPIATLGPGGEARDGIARGIDDDGALRVERADGAIERIVAGEVGVRARPTAP